MPRWDAYCPKLNQPDPTTWEELMEDLRRLKWYSRKRYQRRTHAKQKEQIELTTRVVAQQLQTWLPGLLQRYCQPVMEQALLSLVASLKYTHHMQHQRQQDQLAREIEQEFLPPEQWSPSAREQLHLPPLEPFDLTQLPLDVEVHVQQTTSPTPPLVPVEFRWLSPDQIPQLFPQPSSPKNKA